jgi:hypothetical protein
MRHIFPSIWAGCKQPSVSKLSTLGQRISIQAMCYSATIQRPEVRICQIWPWLRRYVKS